ncbi:DUF4333 domain-containing protein [Streptomyces sp. NBC_00257]|uniref:DUF4333 domain-containing protein n=1 Tax=unclassified Streptomyces TaxID=2593676 RepID=UPI0022568094|nr:MULTISPECIES: DUF4333 domain-containing protein [unclassified Streptomyces]WTB54834.1 DUF4333 domain-containing protein [Streptomyces sp. NBC_00826]WTH92280.1 DUF4333 domain-containing protein [Streptomyces sp. NBC_00825]WTI01009.1 DUF4333 domain-containing protein [Streptomyces sp. NBC_00822]MCX4866576.1 DUF4333 domain-containing protein [Streptomyces sp. NBC_00906]MCX4897814.1 DUF4333 domain-containing protein [Streptomyces sp. NBC_00892]
MTDQGKFARFLITLSAVVVAGCALTVTIKVMNTDTEALYPPRLLDQEAVELQAARAARGPKNPSRDGVECPTAMEAKKGNKFDCRVLVGYNDKTVTVEVIDDQGRLSMNAS